MRDLSLAAGLSHGYVHGILHDGKEPTLDRFIRICEELNVSLSFVLMGAQVTPASEAILQAIESDPQARERVLLALRKAGVPLSA